MSRKMIDYKVEGNKISTIDGYKVGGGEELTGESLMNATKDSTTITRTLDTDGKVKLDAVGGGGGKLYNHHIKGKESSSNRTLMYLILQSFRETPFTKEDLMNYVKSTNEIYILPCYGFDAWSTPSILFTFVKITSEEIYLYNPYCKITELNKNASLNNCYMTSIGTIIDDVHPAL